MTAETAIGLAILLPLCGAIGILLTGSWPNLRESITIATSLLTFVVVATLVEAVMEGARPALVILTVLPGVPLAFEVEPLGMLYALVAAGLWIPSGLYTIGYCRAHHEQNQTRFFACFALSIFAALGIAFSGNMFTLFLFYEVLTFSTYPLVTHYGDGEARRAGRIYLGLLLGTSGAFLLFAIFWTWHLTGTLDFTPGGILTGRVDGTVAMVLLGLYAFGTGKAALMPFHSWLPAAMVAPTPVSALLHAVAIVKAGVFTVLKVIIYIFGPSFLLDTGASEWLTYAAVVTLLTSSIIALTKDNLKARLAYSTISQLAYVVLGGALATTSGILGAGMHIAMHAMGKITLFFCAGAIFVAHHKKDISKMNGIGRAMPFTMTAFILGSFSIIGLPPMGGLWSKWFLGLGAIEAGKEFFVAVLMFSSISSVAYLLPVVVRAFFFKPDRNEADHDQNHDVVKGFWANLQEAPVLCVAPLCLTAIGCIVLFFYASDVYDLLKVITVEE